MIFALALGFAITFAALMSSRVRNNPDWTATVTPLASIIGSGFLVAVPLLASALGLWAVPTIIALCAFAYLIGGVIRFNIQTVEPALTSGEVRHHKTWASIEGASQLVLAFAYLVSVAYYLSLLAMFFLRLIGVGGDLAEKLFATSIIVVIAGIGAVWGLKAIEKAEIYSVSLKIAVIVGLLMALAVFGTHLPEGYAWTTEKISDHPVNTDTVRFLLGLLIIVQGFETSRYMGSLYGSEIRMRAMRRAQIISAGIYVVFFILMIPLYPFFTPDVDIAGFIDVIGRVSFVLPFVITIAAVASQFSASVADSIGVAGLISQATKGVVSPRHSYILIGAVGCIIIWETDMLQIIALASRAFAGYYGLQCLLGTVVAYQTGHSVRTIWYLVMTIACASVVVFGVPAPG